MTNYKPHCYISSLILPLFCVSALKYHVQNTVFKYTVFVFSFLSNIL